MSGHRHNPNASTQNQGNSLGDRPAVRQSKLYRTHESGNNMKSLLGTSHLSWDENRQQGAYQGRPVFDHNRDNGAQRSGAYQRHRAMEQDSYSNSTYETTASNYGHNQPKSINMAAPRGYDENYQNNADSRRSYGQGKASSGVADALRDDSDYVAPKPRGNNYSNASSGMASSMSYDMPAQRRSEPRHQQPADYGYGGNSSSQYDRDDYGRNSYADEDYAAYDAPKGYKSLKNQLASDSNSYRRPNDNALTAMSSAANSNRRTSFGAQNKDTRLW